MTFKSLVISAVFAAATLAAPASHAAAPAAAPAVQASPVSLQGDVKLEKTITENGTDRLVLSEPKIVVPGDRLLFTTAYRNDGAKPVTNFVVTNPLPAAVTLAADSPASLEVSVDGGKSWGVLGALKAADGKGGQRGALASDVTHVRWTVASIAPGASGTVSYHAIVR